MEKFDAGAAGCCDADGADAGACAESPEGSADVGYVAGGGKGLGSSCAVAGYVSHVVVGKC